MSVTTGTIFIVPWNWVYIRIIIIIKSRFLDLQLLTKASRERFQRDELYSATTSYRLCFSFFMKAVHDKNNGRASCNMATCWEGQQICPTTLLEFLCSRCCVVFFLVLLFIRCVCVWCVENRFKIIFFTSFWIPWCDIVFPRARTFLRDGPLLNDLKLSSSVGENKVLMAPSTKMAVCWAVAPFTDVSEVTGGRTSLIDRGSSSSAGSELWDFRPWQRNFNKDTWKPEDVSVSGLTYHLLSANNLRLKKFVPEYVCLVTNEATPRRP